MKKVCRIHSLLYRDLLEKGGDKLIAVFCTLKTTRNSYNRFKAFKSANGKAVEGYGLLRKYTGISEQTLKKYVPALVEMGLVYFDLNGDVLIIGNEKSKELYSLPHKCKLIPIVIGKNIIDTADAVFYGRIHSCKKGQEKMIEKKEHRRHLLKQLINPTSLHGQKAAKRIAAKFGKEITLNPEVTLCNRSFSALKHVNKPICDTKSTGQYWKRKMERKGFITTERSFVGVARMSYDEFLNAKKYGEFTRRHVYKNGFLCKERGCKITVNPV